jgi:hypothetical protein
MKKTPVAIKDGRLIAAVEPINPHEHQYRPYLGAM